MDQPRTLETGDYLIELRLGARLTKDKLLTGLEQSGFDKISLDEPVQDVFEGLVRFAATLLRPIDIFDTPLVQWIFTHRASFPLFGNFNFTFRLFPLHRAQRYEMRFFVPMKKASLHAEVTHLLNAMGFDVEKVSLLQKDMRIPGRPVSVAQWFGLGRWKKGSSYVVENDSFLFEDLASLVSSHAEGDPSPQRPETPSEHAESAVMLKNEVAHAG